jgi:hypothetical protein
MSTPKRKETVKNGKKNAALSTQRYLQFAGAHDDILILKNGGLRAVLEVSSVNFNLKSETEQEAIIRGYQQFLNALNFPVQILVRSRKLDIDQYIDSLKEKLKTQVNPLLRNQMAEYIEYIMRLIEYSDIMEKRFFVVVPVNPPRAEKKGLFTDFLAYIKPSDTVANILTRRREFAELKREMDSRLNVVTTSLENCGVSVRQLNTAEIIQILYQAYNPELSRTQKMGAIEELAVENTEKERANERK